LAFYINDDEFLKAQIEQIYVTESKEFELIPKVGRQLILFGGIENMEKKFNNLIAFYKKGMKNNGWTKYKTINLKFENQVVCAKK
ncbi:MAG: cell division protein FtsQ, partial [Bacteroidetes bacterium]